MKSIVLIFLSSFVISNAFPDGAPIDVCVKTKPNRPNHSQAKPQSPETNPFQILQSTTQYGPGSQITVTIQGNANFKGFFIQARDIATNKWIGEFLEQPNTKTYAECSAITHADPKPKAQATFLWQAPLNVGVGQVYFTGTVLKEYSEFWSDIVSQTLAK